MQITKNEFKFVNLQKLIPTYLSQSIFIENKNIFFKIIYMLLDNYPLLYAQSVK